MKNIKLVASDLDGTLLNQKKEITPRLFDALKKLDELGIYFLFIQQFVAFIHSHKNTSVIFITRIV